MVERARDSRASAAIRPLLPMLQRALAMATNEGAYHAEAYQLLEDAAHQGGAALEDLLAAVPPAARLAPEPTIGGYEAAPPGQLLDLLQLLHEEFPLWRDRKVFTSGLRVHAGGLDVARLDAPAAKADGQTALAGKAVSVFSSTPDPVLRQWIGRLGLEVQAEYTPHVALPRSVRMIQDVSGFYGKGTTERQDNDGLLAKARAYLDEIEPARPAVITHMHLRERVSAELAIPPERVLHFGNVRGSNAVRDADALLVIGTPGMAPSDAYWATCAAFRGEGPPPSRRMVMQPLRYGGWQDGLGRGREIDVLTFADPWVAEIYESSRRDELVQAIFRCRPFDIEDAEQLQFGGDEGVEPRRALTVVLLTAFPIVGLRVDELRFGGNAARAEEATARMDEAATQLARTGQPVTARSLADAAGTSKDRANAYLQRVSTPCPPTYRRSLIQVGGQGVETWPDPASATPVATPPAPALDLPRLLADWPEEWRAALDERAGIMEFEGGVAPTEAQAAAEGCVRAEYRRRYPSETIAAVTGVSVAAQPSAPARCHACHAHHDGHVVVALLPPTPPPEVAFGG